MTTEAAVAYLARLYQRNANALRTVMQFIQDSPALIWKLLARRLVFNHEEPTFRPNRTYILWTHTQSNGQTVGDVAFQYNLPTDRLRPFDDWLRGSAIPTEGSYAVLIRMLPEEYAAATGKLENAKQNPPGPDLGFPVLRRLAPVNSKLNTPITLYEINGLPGVQAQPGDNVITLAYYGGISIPQFLEYNDMTDRNVVRPGEVYYLASKLRRATMPFHVLARGQSLWEVSNIYGVRLNYLLRYNDIEPNQSVTSGWAIWLQGSRPRNQPIEYRQLPSVPKPPVLIPQPDSSLNLPVAAVDSTQLIGEKPMNSATLSVDSTAIMSISKTMAATVDSATAVTSTKAPQAKRHIVRAGQTYYAISRLYDVTVIQLYKWNKLSEQIPLRIGQELIVENPGLRTKSNPTRSTSPEPRLRTIFKIERIPIEKSVRSPIVTQYHIVRPGQTVYRVALINKVSIERVMRLNKLRNYTIEVGQRLRIR
ncbi:MAG: LysM peptidoglycan-binding domain-containing protein [Rudanella sp.]|nr:LysM peptidoglycan-binding domain-containing protein [Rudanella sp.]